MVYSGLMIETPNNLPDDVGALKEIIFTLSTEYETKKAEYASKIAEYAGKTSEYENKTFEYESKILNLTVTSHNNFPKTS